MTVTLPDPASFKITSGYYQTPDGKRRPRVTSILRVLGLGTEALVRWSANVEHQAVLMAATEVLVELPDASPTEFIDAVEARMGKVRQHQKSLSEAADIGTSIHQEIQRLTRQMAGLEVGPPQPLVDAAQWAVMAWEDWWKASDLIPVAAEQPVWDEELDCAGTLDLIAQRRSDGRYGLVDYKTSKGIYDTHHLQAAAYLKMGRNFIDLEWVQLVQLPKNVDDPRFNTKKLGELYERTLTEEQLLIAFRAARDAYRVLIEKGASR